MLDCIEETDGEEADADAVAADRAPGSELEDVEPESVTLLLSNTIDRRFLLLDE